MESSLTWLDYSESDRQDALEVINLLRETETVDELGLANVRNSYSDLFFPGTSTLQTRACYFLHVPWTFLKLEEKGVDSSKAEAWIRAEEQRLNQRLLGGDDPDGVFGSRAGNALKRLPSEVYWSGLGSWGIRCYHGYKSNYFKSLDALYRSKKQARNSRQRLEGRTADPSNWHRNLPKPPDGFPRENAAVALRSQDAEYLRDRIRETHPGSLLSALVFRANYQDLSAEWPWDLADGDEISKTLRSQLRDAQHFAVCMHGAALLYNLMLSEQRKDVHLQEAYRRQLTKWANDVCELGAALEKWDLSGVWRLVKQQGRTVTSHKQNFVEEWIEILRRVDPNKLAEGSAARKLVTEREKQVKVNRARLTDSRRLELWGGKSGTKRLNYRWPVGKRLLGDIIEGLKREKGHAGNA